MFWRAACLLPSVCAAVQIPVPLNMTLFGVLQRENLGKMRAGELALCSVTGVLVEGGSGMQVCSGQGERPRVDLFVIATQPAAP